MTLHVLLSCVFSPVIECGSSYSYGPHSMDCLLDLWLEAGCSHDGGSSPSNELQDHIDWWNDRTVGQVRADMELYYEYSMNGNTGYNARCFGKLLHQIIISEHF